MNFNFKYHKKYRLHFIMKLKNAKSFSTLFLFDCGIFAQYSATNKLTTEMPMFTQFSFQNKAR